MHRFANERYTTHFILTIVSVVVVATANGTDGSFYSCLHCSAPSTYDNKHNTSRHITCNFFLSLNVTEFFLRLVLYSVESTENFRMLSFPCCRNGFPIIVAIDFNHHYTHLESVAFLMAKQSIHLYLTVRCSFHYYYDFRYSLEHESFPSVCVDCF